MTEDSKKDYEEESYWQQVRDFNLSRTPFWISFCWELLETIIPFIIIWLLIGPDWSAEAYGGKAKAFNFYDQLPGNKDGYVALISVCYLIWAMGIATICFFLKWQKADVFTYTFALAILCFSIIMLGCWMAEWNPDTKKINVPAMKIGVRFVICFFILIAALFVGVIITTFARNYRYGVEEEDRKLLIAYRNGEKVPSRQQLRIERAKVEAQRREEERKELELYEKEIDLKLEEHFKKQAEEKEAESKMTKEQLRQKKLDEKEARKRQRDKRKNSHDTKEITGLD